MKTLVSMQRWGRVHYGILSVTFGMSLLGLTAEIATPVQANDCAAVSSYSCSNNNSPLPTGCPSDCSPYSGGAICSDNQVPNFFTVTVAPGSKWRNCAPDQSHPLNVCGEALAICGTTTHYVGMGCDTACTTGVSFAWCRASANASSCGP